jgi:DNA-binding XRE family transcriptional regulator
MIEHEQDGTASLEGRRLALGYSRERLGAAAGGLSAATVFRVERGMVVPRPATRVALARALGCRVSDLFSEHGRGATRA